MLKRLLAAGLLSVFGCGFARADLITTFDFLDGRWASVLTASGGNNDSTVTSSAITVAKSGSTGGVRVAVNLTGSISTVGFENIRLEFFGNANGTAEFEWNGNLTGAVASTDGFRIIGSGVEINANALNDISGTAAETDIDSGSVFMSGGNLSGSFVFLPSANNGSISDLSIILQSNAGTETLALSNFQLFGDVVAVPEASTFALGLAAAAGGFVRLRRRRK
ncbi:hypothetical protein Poly51_53150 [Rubripirellula tenax]|uniref:PEP-CTERM protein-sorting domain-containing protein n=1 Tax=Rubripirellula tenax TaxID=2528015 RepID=A0A5C6EGE5_9BACT|nr:hypothetical protein [Rubripirellula tenax]TWU47515.1 hypothetical protein Poly51_53150 [Rubripirellula tenax]